MRLITMWILGAVLALGGCGSSEGSGGSGGAPGSGGMPGSGGSAGAGGDGSGGPTITMVAWETAAVCDGATDYTVTITVSDPDTDPADLVFSGSVGGCTGPLDAAVSVINCPNVAPYPGTVMVTDDDGNESTPVAFDIGVCETSSCTTDPDTCS